MIVPLNSAAIAVVDKPTANAKRQDHFVHGFPPLSQCFEIRLPSLTHLSNGFGPRRIMRRSMRHYSSLTAGVDPRNPRSLAHWRQGVLYLTGGCGITLLRTDTPAPASITPDCCGCSLYALPTPGCGTT
jgi:hypothetical protein